jgi:hypothetical protein
MQLSACLLPVCPTTFDTSFQPASSTLPAPCPSIRFSSPHPICRVGAPARLLRPCAPRRRNSDAGGETGAGQRAVEVVEAQPPVQRQHHRLGHVDGLRRSTMGQHETARGSTAAAGRTAGLHGILGSRTCVKRNWRHRPAIFPKSRPVR